MDISLRNLKLVNVIVKEGSLTKASEKLFLSQPALSHQLKKLEEDIGLKVFNRLNKKLILTEAGEVLFKTSEKLLVSLTMLNTELDEIKRVGNKKISLTIECYTCYHWLPKVVKEFRKNNPEINVEINIEATKNPLQNLMEGEIDIAIVSNIKNVVPAVHFEPLITDEMVVILSKENHLSELKTLELSDLRDENLILYDIPEKKNYVLNHILKHERNLIKSIQKVQLTEAIVELVAANLGISIMAKWAVMPFLEKRNMKMLPFQADQGKRDWFIASLDKISETESLFIEQIKKEFNP